MTYQEMMHELGQAGLTEKQMRAPMTMNMFYSGILPGMAATLKEHIDPLVARLEGHIAKLEARIAELEARPSMAYRGIWAEAEKYAAGDCVTDGGSAWVARNATRARPGNSKDWQLAVKRGKDATSAKDQRR